MTKKIPFGQFYLRRYSVTDHGTYGVVLDPYMEPICQTLELPWRDNRPQLSCIPEGNYVIELLTNRPQRVYVADVPGRIGIGFHPGNVLKDTLGCILPGYKVARGTIYNSAVAMARLCKFVAFYENAKLEVKS